MRSRCNDASSRSVEATSRRSYVLGKFAVERIVRYDRDAFDAIARDISAQVSNRGFATGFGGDRGEEEVRLYSFLHFSPGGFIKLIIQGVITRKE